MEKEFETKSIRYLVLKLGIPAMFAQFFNILYSIVDRMFVGNIPGEGGLALASIGVCAPALSALSAFAFMVGIGGSSLMSMSLGKKRKEEAQKAMNNAILMIAVISVVVTALCLFFETPILSFLGSSEKMLPMAEAYYRVYVAGTFFSLCGLCLNQFLLAQGFAKQGMIAVILGAILNAVLDPVFIFGMHLGITGAAVATVLSQIVVFGYVLMVFLKNRAGNGKQGLTVGIGFGSYSFAMVKRILAIGIMSFLIMILDNSILIILNMSLRKYGGDLGDQYIASGAVIQSFMSVVFCPAQGITNGCATLFSYHYGAGNYKKIMQIFRTVFCVCGIYMIIMVLLAQFFAEPFAAIFVKGTENIELTASFLQKYTIGLLGVAAQYAFVDGLTAMGKIRYALPLSLFRKILYLICLFVLPLVTALENIFYVGTISDLVGGSFTVIVFLTVIMGKLRHEMTGTK